MIQKKIDIFIYSLQSLLPTNFIFLKTTSQCTLEDPRPRYKFFFQINSFDDAFDVWDYRVITLGNSLLKYSYGESGGAWATCQIIANYDCHDL